MTVSERSMNTEVLLSRQDILSSLWNVKASRVSYGNVKRLHGISKAGD